jgi:aspartate kinase
MKIKIMKFGGTSLSDPEKIRLAAGRAAAEKKKGFSVVLVLSAPGQITDELFELAARITQKPKPRELDALLSTGENLSAALAAMALEAAGHSAVSLSGAQAGLLTDSNFSNAGLLTLRPARVISELKKGRIAVVAGFQGISKAGDTTTLGRGGSDLTAVALANTLKAKMCELYSDVKGIYTANPALVSSARKLTRISYDEIIALAEAGTEVRQLCAISYAKNHKIPLVLRSSFDSGRGTWVGNFKNYGEKPGVKCFSMQKAGKHAEITLIGSKLNSAEIRKTIQRTVLMNKYLLAKETCTHARITLVTNLKSGTRLLNDLHTAFVG